MYSSLFYLTDLLLLLFPGKLLKGFSIDSLLPLPCTKAVQLTYHKFLFNGIMPSLLKPVSPRVMAP